MKTFLWLITLLPALLVTGCDVKNTPIPLQDSPLVGIWEGSKEVRKDRIIQRDRMYLEFTEAGYVAFHRVNCWADATAPEKVWKMKNFSIDFMPVIKLNQKKAKAQWMPFTPKVELSLDQWPEDADGSREMVVDGMRLVQVPEASERAGWTCDNMAASSGDAVQDTVSAGS
ncbi:MAG: hypothetical protein R3208_02280 [Ketobacteraceae bacterium]|nr:hypothetical protein [Ketobacteraceae bacterium]